MRLYKFITKEVFPAETAYLGLPDTLSSITKPILGKKNNHITISYTKGTDMNDTNTGANVRPPPPHPGPDVDSAAPGCIGTEGNFSLAKTQWGS